MFELWRLPPPQAINAGKGSKHCWVSEQISGEIVSHDNNKIDVSFVGHVPKVSHS